MEWKPRIVSLSEKKLIGKKIRMSLEANQTYELWRSFMPERGKINNTISSDLLSIRVYDKPMEPSNRQQQFDKWAAVEVEDFDEIPDRMEAFVLKDGLYAVFDYQGLSTDNKIFIYIFRDWLPGSEYELDQRPQFEVLGEKFKNNDPGSQEEIWIPIKPKY